MRPIHETLAADLLEAGKQEFLPNGYNEAFLQNIAPSPGLTTGAFAGSILIRRLCLRRWQENRRKRWKIGTEKFRWPLPADFKGTAFRSSRDRRGWGGLDAAAHL